MARRLTMLTPLGKTIRKLRIDNGLLLKDMAEGIKVTSAYLSAVETGKKSANRKLLSDIENFLDRMSINFDSIELEKAFIETQEEFSVPLVNFNAQRLEAAVAFARNFNNLSNEELEEMAKILNKRKNSMES